VPRVEGLVNRLLMDNDGHLSAFTRPESSPLPLSR